MALHHTAGWKVVIAATFAVVATTLLFGSVLTGGYYGRRPYIGVDLGVDLLSTSAFERGDNLHTEAEWYER
jgi:hypothetical protein